ncbi:MAG: GNAT family N-acetyltransferase [Pseudomonadota bacterium]
MPELQLRAAKQSEAADLAILDNLASYGLSCEYWLSLSETRRSEEAFAIGRQRFADDNSINGWKNAIVAVESEVILGMSTCYINHASSGANSSEGEDHKRLSPAFVPLFELHDIADGHWYIDCLAVFPQARGKRVGAMLMDDFIDRGKAQGFEHASLIVESGNKTARQLYESRGFTTTETRPIVEFSSPYDSKEWLLLTATL